jgi:hypothetical protein
MDDAGELRLAQSFADILDGAARDGANPELAGELATLAEMDRVPVYRALKRLGELCASGVA